ncbi:UNVERIFIED_CONTAM: rhomboid protease GluP [Acetivibrio alkalicellulosi]
MKKKFMDFVYAKLIDKMDYLPLTYKNGDIVHHDNIRILQKSTGHKLELVELIDGDLLSLEQIKTKLESNRKKIDQLVNLHSVCIFEVFIFSSHPEKDKISLLSVENSIDGKNILCYSVNMSDKSIMDHTGLHVSKNSPLMILNKAFDQNYTDSTNSNNINELVRKKIQDSYLKFSAKTPYLSYTFIILNIAVLIVMYLISNFTDISYIKLIVDYGAKDNTKILMGEYWRFLTPIFFHTGVPHLLVNCYSLYIIGTIVEKLYGHKKFAFIYIVAGVFGSIMSFMFSTNPSVGASGSIFGLIGALLYFGIESPELFKKYFKNTIVTIIILNAGMIFVSANIDNFGHLGGLIGGFLASGTVKIKKVSNKLFSRPVFIAATTVLLIIGLYYGFYSNQAEITKKTITLEQLAQNGQWAQVEVLGEEILAMNPSNPIVLISVLSSTVNAKSSLEKHEEAIEMANQIKSIDVAHGHYILGITYFKMENYQLAKEELTQLLRLTDHYNDSAKYILEVIEQITMN